MLFRVIDNKSYYNLDNKNMLRKVTVKIGLERIDMLELWMVDLTWFYFPFLFLLFLIFFFILFLSFFFFILDLGGRSNITLHVAITQPCVIREHGGSF